MLYHTFRSVIHFELTLVNGVMSVTFHVNVQLLQHHLLKYLGFFNFYCYLINWDYSTGLRTQHNHVYDVQMLGCYIVVTGPRSLYKTHRSNSSVHLQFGARGTRLQPEAQIVADLTTSPPSSRKMTRRDCSTCFSSFEEHNPIWTPASSSAETITLTQNIQTKITTGSHWVLYL